LASSTNDNNWDTIKKSAQKCYVRWKATQPRSQSVDYSKKNRYSKLFNKKNRESLHNTSDTTPKHLRYKRKIRERNLLDDRVVRDILMPKFEVLGLGNVLKVSLPITGSMTNVFRGKYLSSNSRKPSKRCVKYTKSGPSTSQRKPSSGEKAERIYSMD
jgi:hypothetical protein